MTRAEKVAVARQLRGEGLLLREIAERLSVSVSTVDEWLHPERDPGARKRREEKRPGEPCPSCGAPRTRGQTRSGEVCRRCRDVAVRAAHEARRAEIERLWNLGVSLADIAAALDSTTNSIGVEMVRMRSEGVYSLPFRRQAVAA